MNLKIEIDDYAQAVVTADLGPEFAATALSKMRSGDSFNSCVPGYSVYDHGDDWVVLWARGSQPDICVGRVNTDGARTIYGIWVWVNIGHQDLDYTKNPEELDLDATLTAARALRLALRAFDVIQ